MKRGTLILGGLMLIFQNSFSQISGEENSFVAADFQGILNLTLSGNQQVDFAFNSVNDYINGVVKYNVVKLEVDATLPWDLFAYANTDQWVQSSAYSTNGESALPAEILEIQSSVKNTSTPLGGNFNSFSSLKGLGNSGVSGGIPNSSATQFLAGMSGTGAGKNFSPGSAKSNRETNEFKLHYRIVPGMPAKFPNSTVSLPGDGIAQAGNYYLEIVFALVEDL